LPEQEPLHTETKPKSTYPSNVYDSVLAVGEIKNSKNYTKLKKTERNLSPKC
jgi:hypothetical protein